jgi:hypothetical protein
MRTASLGHDSPNEMPESLDLQTIPNAAALNWPAVPAVTSTKLVPLSNSCSPRKIRKKECSIERIPLPAVDMDGLLGYRVFLH